MKSEFLAYLNRKLLFAFSLCLFISSASYGQLTCSSTDGSDFFGPVSGIQFDPLVINANQSVFTENSATNGFGDANGDGDIGNPAWGLFAQNNFTSEAIANFDFPVNVLDVISISMDNGFQNNGSVVGFGLQNEANQNLFEFYFTGGASEYTINDANGPTGTGIGYTTEGLDITITITSSNSASVSVSRIEGPVAPFIFNVDFIPQSNGQTPAQIRLFNFNAGGGTLNNAYFNNLEICQSIVDLDYDGILSDVDCDDSNNAIGLPITLYADTDGDGFGDSNNSIISCPTPGFVTDNTDCDDTSAGAFPGNPSGDIPFNGLNDDCDPNTPEENSGLFESFIVINGVFYDLNTQTGNADFNGANLGSFDCNSALTLDGGENKTFRLVNYYEGNILNGTLAYRIYETGMASGSFSNVNLPFFDEDDIPANNLLGQNQIWQTTSAGVNLNNGLTPGNYTLEVYTSADYTYFGGSGTHFINDGGNNYTATFTIEEDLTPPSLTIPSNVTVECGDDESSASTGTATASDNCGNVTITESDVISTTGGSSVQTLEILLEDFENSSSAYSTSITECTDGEADFFINTDGSNIGSGMVYIGATGNFFGASDIDADCGGNASNNNGETLTITNIDISSYNSLTLYIDAAEDDASDGDEDWDDSDFVHVDISIDGAPFIPAIWFENDGSTFNAEPQIDSDFDGIGDGATLTSTFQTFSRSIVGTGSTADIRITIALDSGDEDIAIDNVRLTGEALISEDFCGNTKVITRTWTATDDNGNSTSADQIITVEDNTAPMITAPADVTLECGADESSANTGMAIASDNCGNVTITESDEIFTGGGAIVNSCFAIQGFETSGDNWAPTFSTPPCTSGSDRWDYSTTLSSITPSEGSQFWGITDLQGDCGGSSYETITFPSIDVSSYSTVELSFDYYTIGFDGGNGDDIAYEVWEDGSPTTINLNDNTEEWVTITYSVAESTNNVYLVIKVKQNGSDYAGIDNIKLCGDSESGAFCGNTKVITRTWTATDDCGNSESADQIITIEDTTPPTLTLPADITIACGDDESSANTGVATGTDACGSVSISESSTEVAGCGNTKTITRTWTATDACGNSVSGDQTITIEDTTPPTIDCPSDISVGTDQNACDAVVTYSVNFSDLCGTASIEQTAGLASGATFPVGTTTNSFLVTDACGNTSTCSFDVIVTDNEAPTAVCQDLTIQLDANGNATLNPEDINNGSADVCGIASMSLSQTAFDCSDLPQAGPVATELIISEYVEGSSNNKYIELYNGTPNEIDLSDYEIRQYNNGSGSVSFSATLGFIGTIESGGVVVLSNSSAIAYAGTTYDISGNTMGFNGDDAIELYNNASSQRVDLFGAIGEDPGSFWSVGGNQTQNQTLRRISSVIDGNLNDLSGFPALGTEWAEFPIDDVSDLGSHTTDGGGDGTVPVTLTVIDMAGNESTCTSSITVEVAAPIASCQDITIALDATGLASIEAADIDNGSSVTCGELTLLIDNGQFDCSNLDENIVNLVALDEFGNSDTCQATVTIVDNIAPVASCQNIVIELDANGSASISADDIDNGSSDNCGIDLKTIDVSAFSCSDIGIPGGVPVQLTVTDLSGNSSNCTAFVTVVDNLAPIATCTNLTVALDASGTVSITPQELGGSATDNCAIANIEISQSTFDCSHLGVNSILVTITDVNGNQSTCTSEVTVVDETAPEVICQNLTIQLDENGEASITPEQVDNGSNDACDIESLQLSQTEFNCGHLGANQVTLSVTDANGNIESCTATVTIEDALAPTISAPADLAITTDVMSCTAENIGFDAATGSDNCSGLVITSDAPAQFPIGVTVVTWTAMDVSGNTATAEQTVTVSDNEAPTIIAPADISQAANTGVCFALINDLGNATVTDNCEVLIPTNDAPASFPVGFTTVTWSVMDAAGNSSSTTQLVEIIDAEAPTVVCVESYTVQLNENGTGIINPADLDDGSFDNCANVTFSVDNASFDCSDLAEPAPAANDLFISEYIEGSSNNKCIEIYNGTGAAIDLGSGDYDLVRYTNGSTGFSGTIDLTGIIENGEVYVVCNPSAGSAFTNLADQTSGSMTHNGDDAIVLRKSEVPIDIFGKIGEDPGSQWSVDGNMTANRTLVRIPTVTDGNTDNLAGFPSLGTEWVEFPTDNTDDLGQHTSVVGGPSTESGITVMLTVTDDAGNSSSCPVSVTVEDNVAPNVICQYVEVYLDANGEAVLSASDVNNNSTDVCGIASMELDITEFDCTNLVADDNGPIAFINEFHYDNSGPADTGEFVEIVVQNTIVADNYSIHLYNGANGTLYDSDLLGAPVGPNGDFNIYVINYPSNGLQNGAPDGIALADENGELIEFISYEGSFTAIGGPADGVTSTNVGVSEPGAVGESIQRVGIGSAGANFTWTGPEADSPGMVNNGQTFAPANLVNPVTLTVTDINGNSASCVASVNVIDNLPPVLSVQNINLALDENGMATVTAADVDNGTLDNCSIESMELNATEFDCNNVGENTLQFTATDASGNSASTDVTITIEDNTAPTANCLTEIDVELGPNGDATILAADLDNGSTDNCGVVGLSLNDDTFDCSDLPDNTAIEDAAWINEIHYDNSSVDVDELVEVAANFDITDHSVVFYNGNGGSTYFTASLSSADIGETTSSGFTFYSISDISGGIQNGGPDGIALVDGSNQVVQFLSYEGSFTASNGPAAGITSEDIGVVETSSTPAGLSLQLAGTGSSYTDFTWQSPTAESGGELNNNQTISGGGGTEIILTVSDAAGNESTCATIVNVIDGIEPIVACQDITVSLDANGEVSVLAADIDAGSYDACAGANITTSISKSDFDCDDLGEQTVTLTVSDGNGNNASCTSTVTIIDDIAPIAICQNIMVELDETGNAFISEMDVDGGSTDNCGIENYWVSLDRFDCSDLGDNIVELHVTDASGNTSICEAIVSVKDFVAPNAVCQDAVVYLDENGFANIDVDDINNGSTDNCEISSISLSQTAFTCDDIGTVQVTMTVTDGYDNVATCTAEVTVVDNIAPTVTCQNQTLALGADGTLEINVGHVTTDFDDNCQIDSGTLSQSTFDCTNIGENVIDVTIYDLSGNSSTCASTITIVDNTPPVAMCQNITVQLDDTGEATITANDVDAGSSDNCSIASVSIDNAIFTCANIGTNNVVLTVTDAQGLTDYCTAIVTVEDNMAPTAICQPLTVILDANGVASVSPESVNNGSTDNCGLASLALSQSDFTCADLGSNSVILTVTDVNGNTSTCETTITVNDETAPTMACTGVTLELDENGIASLSTDMIDSGSSDNCGSVSLSLDITSFDCTNVGDNLVTLTGTDASGNTSACTAIVTVVDTEAPELTCHNIEVSLDETGFTMISAEQLTNTPSDNCGIESLEITSGPIQFGCEDENQVYTVTVTATDVNGNSASCDAQVSIIVEQDADGDGVGDACDFCMGDDSAGDTDGDGICDDMDSCPGFDDMADPDANCDVSTTLNTWWFYAANGGTYCIDGPYNGGHITVVNGSTVRLSGSGHVSVSLYYGGKLEVMEGSDITFSYLGVHWGAAGMVVYPNAEITYNGTFSPNADVVNCGTFTVRKLRVNYSGSFVNNGTLEIIHSYAKSTVHGDLINNGTLHTNGSLAVYHNGEFVNNCHAEIDDDLFVHRHVRNTAFINVGHTTRIYYHGRIHLYDGAMFQTSSNVQFGRILGNGSTSLFKVNHYTVGYWGSKVSGSVAYCDVDGIELLYANNYFQNGASEDCNVTIPVDGCNPNGHAPFFGPSGISISSDDLEVIESTDLSVILTDDEKQMIAENGGAITQLTVWPNPTKDKTTLTIVPANDDRMVVELYSVNGELVSRVFEGDAAKYSIITQEIDLSKYENGVYFIRVIESSDIQTKKIVLAR